MNTLRNVDLDYEMLKISADIASAIRDNNIELSQDVISRISSIENFNDEYLSVVKDLLSPAVYDDINEAHFNIIEGLKDYNGMFTMHRMASIIFISNHGDEQKQLQYLEDSINKETIITGKSADYFFCSNLIRLAFNLKRFDSIEKIREILNQYEPSVSEEV